MPKSVKDQETLKQALESDWPEIQKHLIENAAKERGDVADPYKPYWTTNRDGTRTLHASADSWWLKDFDRKDVIMQLPGVVIMNTKTWHTSSVCITLREAYGLGRGDDCADCFTEDDISAHIERFADGSICRPAH